ncbi:MAG: hypothetical protein M3Q49_04360 [Actinomycetota bacterium]|nr:hypothetical protein [Actinomycetota bacterium]
MSTPDAQQFRVRVQGLIGGIITSGASRERMNAMLLNVHRAEKWPDIHKELRDLERLRRGEGGVL